MDAPAVSELAFPDEFTRRNAALARRDRYLFLRAWSERGSRLDLPPLPTLHDMNANLQPHRGTLILVLGIVGLVCCFPVGIAAWIMGNGDLKAMAEGRMDPTGEGMTKAGKICGIISVILNCLGIIVWVAMIALGVASGVMNQ